jgi:CRISPR-associated endonuclease Cas1
MAATQSVLHRPQPRNFAPAGIAEQPFATPTRLSPHHGVITLFGYGIEVRVERGHLVLKDGVGHERREGRFARVNHGIQRLVVIGADGVISLSAIQWLADQRASFVMLNRDGSVLAVTGPVSASDARLRRAQSCAAHSDAAVSIAQELIRQKLAGQEKVARERLQDARAADLIAGCGHALDSATTVSDVRLIESQGSSAYWAAWRNLRIDFPKSDLRRVPAHWREFGSRTSPVSTGARNAANPANAMLNYLYTILEAETRLTVAALGLDPGLGILHIDKPTRDSLACDVMEPVRPSVDAFLIDWLTRSPLKREWFFEQRDGTCRLMPALAFRLGETALRWRREVAPYAEWLAAAVCSASPDSKPLVGPQTRLTRRRWREAMRRDDPPLPKRKAFRPQSVCETCGAVISARNRHCKACAVAVSTKALVAGARAGRIAALSAEAQARRHESSQRQNEALQAWNPANHPAWLTNDMYVSQVQPRLLGCTRPAIAEAIGVSVIYAGEVRNGTCVPHKRHWLKLAELVGFSARTDRE